MDTTSPAAAAPVLHAADKALRGVEWLTAWIAGITIFALMVMISAEVVLRRLFDAPIRGQVDVTELTMVSFGVLCVSYCYRHAGHIRMDLLLKVVGGRGRWIAELFVTLVAFAVVTVLLPGAWAHFERAFDFGDSTIGMSLPTWPSKLAVAVGLAILWLRLLLAFWVYGRLAVDPAATPVAVPVPPDPRKEMDA